jgi:hypothetical protein
MSKFKEIYHSFLRVIFKDVPTSLYRLVLSVLIVYSVLPFFFYPQLDFYRVYYILSIIVINIIALCAILYCIVRLCLDRYYKNIQTKKLNVSHVAIILIRYNILFKSLFYPLMKLKYFFNILNKNSIPYTVYLVKSKEEFIDIINNKQVKSVFVFSHGQRHGIKFGNEIWHYCNLPKVKHIQFVGQFHCNHYSGKTLYEHLGCNGVMTQGVTLYQDINKYILSEEYVSVLKKLFKIKY